MKQLPEPRFIETDQQAVLESCIREYEELTGRTLYPAQSERLLINLIAYREHLVRVGIQEAAKQNLVRYAHAPMLDMLGELVGVTRLTEETASCTVRFSVKESLAADLSIPAGVKIYSRDGACRFDTLEAVTLPAGELFVDAAARCSEGGAAANGILPGGVCQLADPLADADVRATNTETTSGGADAEDDGHLRERIMLAPEAYSTAGSELAYRFHALSASSRIADVGVLSPVPGVVDLYLLTPEGLPSAALVAVTAAYVSGKKVRPLTDTVHVYPAKRVVRNLRAELTLYEGADADAVRAAAVSALDAWREDKRLRLGVDVVRTQIIALLSVYGVYSVSLLEPAEDYEAAGSEWVDWQDVNISLVPERKHG